MIFSLLIQAICFAGPLAVQSLALTHTPLALTNTYTYDNAGNRLSKTDNNGLHAYAYDNLYRLVSSTSSSETYAYDALGNRNPLTSTYDASNRLLDDGIFTYTYDHNGNMTKKVNKITGETTTYSYDAQDRLVSLGNGVNTSTYKYDALGRRIEKNVNGVITRHIYDGEDIIAEYDANNNLIASYTHGPSIDEPLILTKSGQKYYFRPFFG